MTEIRISGATLRAWRGGHNRTYRDLERAGRAGTEAAETESEIAGLRAAITQWLAEQRTLDGLAAQQGVRPIGDVSELAIDGITDEERAAYLAALEPDPVADLLAALTDEHGRHRYLSTGCYHGEHGYCSAMTGQQGVKRPATCKFGGEPCICPCHQEERDRAHTIALERERRQQKWTGTAISRLAAATPAVAGAPDITDNAIYQQARQGGADHVEAMRLATDPDADWPIH